MNFGKILSLINFIEINFNKTYESHKFYINLAKFIKTINFTWADLIDSFALIDNL